MPKGNKADRKAAASAKKSDTLVTNVSQLANDQKCIYQAMNALEGIDMDALGQEAMQSGKVKEIDDEGAAVVLADKHGYSGPTYSTGTAFKALNLSGYSKVFVIVSKDVKVKNTMSGVAKDKIVEMMMDPAKMKGINFHAIGIEIVKKTRVVRDVQELRKNGPDDNDNVLYWTK